MGLHCGFIVATAGKADLLRELSRHTGEFTVGAEVARVEDAGPDLGMLLGERDGRAFLLDTLMVLSNSPDLIVALSAGLGTVLGCGAETVSGSYWLTAARDGEPLRHVFVSHAAMTRGMAIGDPLPSEHEHPIEDLSGGGVFAAMASFGLDPSEWLDSGPATAVTYDYSRPPEGGQIDAIVSAHFERYERPDGEWLKDITVVATEGPR